MIAGAAKTAGRLTVVQLLPALESGGVERGTVELSAHLVAEGHRSIVVSAGGRLVATLLAHGAEHVAWAIGSKSLRTLRYVPRLRRLLQETGAHILHARSRLPAWTGYLAWRRMDPGSRPRLVTTVHGFYSVSRYSGVMARGERVIAVSEAVRDYILHNYPWVEPGRIRVIPRGVDRKEYPHGFRPAPDWIARWQSQHPELQGKLLVTLPGRVSRLKGHEDFITLLRGLRAGGLPVHGLVAGGVDPRHEGYGMDLRKAAARAGVQEAVAFLGHRDDLREVLAVSSLVLSLSHKPESFGRTVLEALSLGVPVVGYEHGGVGEVLGQILPSGRVPVGEHASLLRRCKEFLLAPPGVPATHPFSLERMLRDTVELYQSLAEARQP